MLPGGDDEEAGARAARVLLDCPELPTAVVAAVVAANDRSAIGLLEFARLAHIDLTTVNQEARKLARRAVGRQWSALMAAGRTRWNWCCPRAWWCGGPRAHLPPGDHGRMVECSTGPATIAP